MDQNVTKSAVYKTGFQDRKISGGPSVFSRYRQQYWTIWRDYKPVHTWPIVMGYEIEGTSRKSQDRLTESRSSDFDATEDREMSELALTQRQAMAVKEIG